MEPIKIIGLAFNIVGYLDKTYRSDYLLGFPAPEAQDAILEVAKFFDRYLQSFG